MSKGQTVTHELKEELRQRVAERDEARAELDDLRAEIKRWDELVTGILGPNTALRIDTLQGDIDHLKGWYDKFHRMMISVSPEIMHDGSLKRMVTFRVAIGALETHNWQYGVSAELFQRVGLTERDCVHISQQIGALFYKRLMDELGKARDGIAKAGNDQRGQPVGDDAGNTERPAE